MTSKESREWAASIEQSRQQVVADRLASITHWRMVQARNERRKMYPYRNGAAQRGSKTMNNQDHITRRLLVLTGFTLAISLAGSFLLLCHSL